MIAGDGEVQINIVIDILIPNQSKSIGFSFEQNVKGNIKNLQHLVIFIVSYIAHHLFHCI